MQSGPTNARLRPICQILPKTPSNAFNSTVLKDVMMQKTKSISYAPFWTFVLDSVIVKDVHTFISGIGLCT